VKYPVDLTLDEAAAGAGRQAGGRVSGMCWLTRNDL